jgi:hypothetical protein
VRRRPHPDVAGAGGRSRPLGSGWGQPSAGWVHVAGAGLRPRVTSRVVSCPRTTALPSSPPDLGRSGRGQWWPQAIVSRREAPLTPVAESCAEGEGGRRSWLLTWELSAGNRPRRRSPPAWLYLEGRTAKLPANPCQARRRPSRHPPFAGRSCFTVVSRVPARRCRPRGAACSGRVGGAALHRGGCIIAPRIPSTHGVTDVNTA